MKRTDRRTAQSVAVQWQQVDRQTIIRSFPRIPADSFGALRKFNWRVIFNGNILEEATDADDGQIPRTIGKSKRRQERRIRYYGKEPGITLNKHSSLCMFVKRRVWRKGQRRTSCKVALFAHNKVT